MRNKAAGRGGPRGEGRGAARGEGRASKPDLLHVRIWGIHAVEAALRQAFWL